MLCSAAETMMKYRQTIRDLPLVLRRLRQRAGHKSQRAALRAIRRKTGVNITPTRISEWERGLAVPSLPSIIAFLTGLGYDFTDFQQEIERVAGEPAPEPAKPKPPVVEESRRERLDREIQEMEAYRRSLWPDGPPDEKK